MAVKKNDAAPKGDAGASEDDARGVADHERGRCDARECRCQPREGTTAPQNAMDWNDPKRVRADDADFTCQGVDRAVYGKAVG